MLTLTYKNGQGKKISVQVKDKIGAMLHLQAISSNTPRLTESILSINFINTLMKNSKKFWKGNMKVEIWSEDVNGRTDYWKKEKGVSYSITERHYNNLLKKQSPKKG